jgi:hypothetical protein
MKITRRQLRQIIQEELGRTPRESPSIPTRDQWTAMSPSDRDKVAEDLEITTEKLKDLVADQPQPK